MEKKASITDFFKPSTRPRAPKRPLLDNNREHAEPPRKSRSLTPSRIIHPVSDPSNETTSSQDQRSASSVSSVSRDRTEAFQEYKQEEIINECSLMGEKPLEESLADQLASIDSSASQGPLLASSQRIVRNGEIMIRNSDDEGSDSDSSLGEIDDLLRSRKNPDLAVSSPLTDLDSSTPSSTLQLSPEVACGTRSRTRAALHKDTMRRQPPLPHPPKYRFDLETLVQRSAKYETAEACMSKARKTLESIEQRGASRAAEAPLDLLRNGDVDAALITSALKGRGESNEVEKLLMAIHRTEALQREKSWLFFEDGEEKAFLGGYVDAIASSGRLPDEVILWLADAACFEPRDDLRRAYGQSVSEATQQVTSLITLERINILFGKLGARKSALHPESPLVPVARVPASKIEGILHRPMLETLLMLVFNCAANLSVEARRHSICLLYRLLIDESIIRNPCIIVRLEDTLEHLIQSMPEDSAYNELQKIAVTLYSSIADITLRSQLVNNMPAFTPNLSLLRRWLSLAFFFNDTSYFSKESEKLVHLGSVSHRLRKPDYCISKNTDCTELAASVLMISIGVDNGDRPLPGLNEKRSLSFDEAIDMLSREIKAMNDRIVDSGASHTGRTQAKQVLESFHSRLLYAIRIKPPPPIKSILTDMSQDSDTVKKQVDFMKKRFIPDTKQSLVA
ncbi:MAG: hypothetical protein Q9195_007258 [Heterodermia aff. obscurata]